MSSMNGQIKGKLNWLEANLPEGLVVDAAWMEQHGFSRQQCAQYVERGWLCKPARGVYRRPRGELKWEQVVISAQMLMNLSFVVGGRTALEFQGFGHYLARQRHEVHLYGLGNLPSWMKALPIEQSFVWHNQARLFAEQVAEDSQTSQPWGQFDWPFVMSSPERAMLEFLDELPGRESFHQADMVMEGLANLSPRRLQPLLEGCRSIKVKRLFFFFADRHRHVWLDRLDRDAIDLGRGKRMLVKGGRYDAAYQITVPEDLDAL